MKKIIFKIFSLIVALIFVSGLLQSCKEDILSDSTESDTEILHLSFNISASNDHAFTRTDDKGHGETESEYLKFEDEIDISDLGIFLFAAPEGNVEKNQEPLLISYTPISQDRLPQIIGVQGAYTVNMNIKKVDLNNKLGITINPESDQKISFRIIIISGCNTRKGTSGTGFSDRPWKDLANLEIQNYQSIIGKLQEWNYITGYIYTYKGSDSTGAATNYNVGDIEHLGMKSCPMFGTCSFNISQRLLSNSQRPENRLYFGEIYMLRALAKVKVIDNIAVKDKGGYPKIVSVEYGGSQSDARPLPYNALEYENGQQVHDPNPVSNITPENPVTINLLELPNVWNNTEPEKRKGKTWIGYVPEQKIGYINNDLNKILPRVKITVRSKVWDETTNDYRKDENGEVEFADKEFEIPIQLSDNGTNESILRNHIYTISVNSYERNIPQKIDFKVEKWNEVPIDLDYTKTLYIAKRMNWNENTYKEYDQNIGELIMKPWTASGSDPLKGFFQIQSPVGLQWQAFLLTTEGTPNAFGFLETDVDGEIINIDGAPIISSSVSGIIDGKNGGHIVIVSRYPASGIVNKAKLQIVVNMPDGSVQEAVLTPEGKEFSNFTVMQDASIQ